MFEKLDDVKIRYQEIGESLADPAVLGDREKWQKLSKEYADLTPIIDTYNEYLAVNKNIEDCKNIIKENEDPDFVEMAKEELSEANSSIEEISERLKRLLIPKDPNDEKNVILEIRGGAGGDEASLFGSELLRMYERFAERMRWGVEEVEMNLTDLGGVNKVVIMIKGKGAYSKLKFESGAHRVQRVPATESQGRIHTSTATVAVLPEAEDIDVKLNMNDVKVDTYRAGGAGGQYVNRTDSAVRMTHIPTGIVVTCQDEKSQLKNKEKAIRVLKTRLYEFYQGQADKEYAENRKSQVGTGDRSERIRTYNFPQGRVTDHRINMTLYSLDQFLDGDILEIVDALAIDHENKLLAEGSV